MSVSLKSLVSAGVLIAVGMVAGRLLGLLREMLLAAQFGAGSAADIAVALLIIPDFITAALMGSAVSAALVPAFAARGEKEALALFWQALLSGAAVFLVLGVLLLPFAPLLVASLSADGQATPERTQAMRIILVALPLTAGTAVVTSWLQYKRTLLTPAFANVLFNSAVLGVLWLLPHQLGWLAAGVVLGSLLRLSSQALAFVRGGGHAIRGFIRPWQLRQALLARYCSAVGSGIFSLLPHYVPYAVMAAMGGGIALFNYAFKMALLPGILGQTVIQLALLPWLVGLHKNTAPEARNAMHGRVLQLAWLASLALSLAVSLASRSLAELCFGHGRMTDMDVAAVGELLKVGVWAMPGIILSSIWQQILFAHERTRAPLLASLAQTLLVVPFCIAGYGVSGPAGVMAGFALIQALPALFLAHQGWRYGLSRHALPSLPHGGQSMAVVMVFLPLALWVRSLEVSPLVMALLAGLCGIAALAIGLLCDPQLRGWLSGKASAA